MWIDEGSVRDEAVRAAARAGVPPKGAPRRRRRLPADVVDELERLAGKQRLPQVERRLREARAAFDAERFRDAAGMLTRLTSELPDAAYVRELLGLTYYRLGQWKKAAAELEAYRQLTGAVDEHHVLADCYRALRRWKAVDELWAELRAASPSAELVMEGRIVAAGALADRGRLNDAIATMRPAARESRRVRDHDLRAWYVLGDLHDRAGDATTAATYFRRVLQHDAHFADVAERLAALGQ
jgi:tetratricopeptide (TPR) repeat protein